jgi:vacuolar-type H+-ATPase subunit F/Vma7
VTVAVFIGDEVTAEGYRLAGLEARVPPRDDVIREFRKALAESEFVILTTATAAMLPSPLVDDAVHRGAPLVLVVPDVVRRFDPPDYSIAVAKALGIAS